MTEPVGLSKWDWLWISLLLIGLVGFGWYEYQSTTPQQHISQQFTSNWRNVLAIDINADNRISEALILQGEDLILLAPTDLDSPLQSDAIENYTSIENFANDGLLDSIASNVFDPQDRQFLALRLLIYADNGTKMKLMPLYQSGIRSISFDRGALEVRAQLKAIDREQIVGTVILSDGEKRPIHLVPVHDRILQGLALQSN